MQVIKAAGTGVSLQKGSVTAVAAGQFCAWHGLQ